MFMTIFYVALALAVAGAICATAAAVVAEHFRRNEPLLATDGAVESPGGRRHALALRYGLSCMWLAGICAVIAAAAYFAG